MRVRVRVQCVAPLALGHLGILQLLGGLRVGFRVRVGAGVRFRGNLTGVRFWP